MLKIKDINSFLAALSNKQKLYLPVDTEKGAKFVPFSEGLTLSKSLNTTRSAKDFFFPQSENLMEFKTEGKTIEIIDTRNENEDFVIFGVRACDVKSFTVLDNVFLNEPVDSYYKNRREHATVISLACNKPVSTCFCNTFGIDAAKPQGDIEAYNIGEEYFLNPNSEKGEKLLNELKEFLEETDEKAVEEQKKVIKERLSKLPFNNLKADDFGGGKTDTFFDSPVWEELSASCLGCGTCTFVCPTCQCYDIKDFKTNNGVKRFRCWDSCMYSDFTRMAGGQPRLTGKERFRQRFLHKLVYYPERYGGTFGCVGCGRCLRSCPVSLHIVKVMKTLAENGGDEA